MNVRSEMKEKEVRDNGEWIFLNSVDDDGYFGILGCAENSTHKGPTPSANHHHHSMHMQERRRTIQTGLLALYVSVV